MSRRRNEQDQPWLRPVVDRFDAERVRSPMVANRISKAVAATMKDFGLSREEIADMMSVELEEGVTAGTLYQYSSEANQRNNIPAYRLIALAMVTGDARLLNAALEGTPFVAIEAKYEPLLQREVRKEQMREYFQNEIDDADAKWRARK